MSGPRLPMPGQPRVGLHGGERLKPKLLDAPSRSADRRVEFAQLLVAGYQHEEAQALTDEAIHHIEEARQRLPGAFFRIHREEFPTVFENQQTPPLVALLLFV